MPLKKLVIPSFKGKGEEAVWWEDHRADVEADLRAAMRGGQTISLSEVLSRARRKKDLRPVTIRLASEDIATARRLADDEGIGDERAVATPGEGFGAHGGGRGMVGESDQRL